MIVRAVLAVQAGLRRSETVSRPSAARRPIVPAGEVVAASFTQRNGIRTAVPGLPAGGEVRRPGSRIRNGAVAPMAHVPLTVNVAFRTAWSR
jgi:hypothetical protein